MLFVFSLDVAVCMAVDVVLCDCGCCSGCCWSLLWMLQCVWLWMLYYVTVGVVCVFSGCCCVYGCGCCFM